MSDKNPNDNAYEIGYKRPPRSTRFKPGRSGNPKGRQKGSRNFATVLEAELNTRISVTENGTRKNITKREATAKHLVNKAATGLLPAVKLLLEQERQQEIEQSPLSNAPRDLLPPDHLVLKSLCRRLMQMEVTPATTAADEARSPQQQVEDAGPADDVRSADEARSSRQQIADSGSGSSTAVDANRQLGNAHGRPSVSAPRNRPPAHPPERFPLGCDPLYPPRQDSGHESD